MAKHGQGRKQAQKLLTLMERQGGKIKVGTSKADRAMERAGMFPYRLATYVWDLKKFFGIVTQRKTSGRNVVAYVLPPKPSWSEVATLIDRKTKLQRRRTRRSTKRRIVASLAN